MHADRSFRVPTPYRGLAAAALTLLVLLAAGHAQAAHSGPLVAPAAFAGNFKAIDDLNVCEAILGAAATQEMVGFKVDPPTGYDDGSVAFSLSPKGTALSWLAADGVTVLAVVVKGGPNYNLYDYFGNGISSDHDNGLVSPLQKGKLPQISHYNVCYQRTVGGDGCTPGYWRNHADRWLVAAAGDDFDAAFGVDLFSPDVTLGWAIWAQGGGLGALARHAAAALLNSYGGVPNGDGGTVDFPYTTAEVIALVQSAAADPALVESVKNLLASANELGCPLSGSSAVPVVP